MLTKLNSGELRKYSYETTAELMPAVICNLGLFGIIYRVVLEVRKARSNVLVVDHKPVMGNLIPEDGSGADLKKLIPEHYSTEIYWHPFNGYLDKNWHPWEDDFLWLKLVEHTKKKRTDAEFVDAQEKIEDALVTRQNVTQQFIQVATEISPKLGTYFTIKGMKAKQRTLPVGKRVTALPSCIHYVFSIQDIKVRSMEVAFPLDDNFEVFTKAWNTTVGVVKKWYTAHKKIPLDIALEARFVQNSSALLSPVFSKNEQTHHCYLQITCSAALSKDWDEFSAEVGAEWLKIPGSRFHWAKEVEQIEGDYKKIVDERWGENISKFRDLLDKL